jgi:ParB family transcriptional regulator, chromosome partitioning protein
MSEHRGHIELDRTLESIRVGVRHRKDPGDIAQLMESIDRLGMLQPITITPEGVLVCGWRRLEAVRRLGWHSVKVWVRSGISDKLQHLLAQQDENQLHKPLTELEKASLYRELKTIASEEAELRKQSTLFGSPSSGGTSGAAPGTGPAAMGETGDARRHAAVAITGQASYSTHERVCALMDWASRKATPPAIRALANDALRKIEQGEPVKPLYEEVKSAFDQTQQPPPPETESNLAQQAKEAHARAKREEAEKGRKNLAHRPGTTSHYRSLRSFTLTWTELDGWTEMYDVDELAASLTSDDWERFDRVVTATIAFRDQLITARRHASASG